MGPCYSKESGDKYTCEKPEPSLSDDKSHNINLDPVPTQSVGEEESELYEDIVVSYECQVCQETDKVYTIAEWYCRECEQHFCDKCKTVHNKIKTTTSHDVVNLQIVCSLCSKANTTKTALYYCRECEEFFCTGCKLKHQEFNFMKDHELIRSTDKIKEKVHVECQGSLSSTLQMKDHVSDGLFKGKIISNSQNAQRSHSIKKSIADRKVEQKMTQTYQ